MNRRILAIDDEPHMLVLLERIIREKTPYEILTTGNALEVPEILERETFDLIITDFRMPKLDGLDVLKRIREQNRRELVVLITAFGTIESAREARALGVFDYITKPFRKEEILATVERAMHWHHIQDTIDRFLAILEREPFREAEEAFTREYVRKLAERYGNDLEEMVRHSGLDRDRLREELKGDTWIEGD